MPTRNRPAAHPITTAEAVETLASAALIVEWYENEHGARAPGAWGGDLRRYRQNLDRLRQAISSGETLGSGAGIVGRAARRGGENS